MKIEKSNKWKHSSQPNKGCRQLSNPYDYFISKNS